MGVKLSILYQTSTNAVRQDFQALIKEWWQQIGVETELRNLNASVFFGGDPGSLILTRSFTLMLKCMQIHLMVQIHKLIYQHTGVEMNLSQKVNGRARI